MCFLFIFRYVVGYFVCSMSPNIELQKNQKTLRRLANLNQKQHQISSKSNRIGLVAIDLVSEWNIDIIAIRVALCFFIYPFIF